MIVVVAAVVVLCVTPFFGWSMVSMKSAAPMERAMATETAEAYIMESEEQDRHIMRLDSEVEKNRSKI